MKQSQLTHIGKKLVIECMKGPQNAFSASLHTTNSGEWLMYLEFRAANYKDLRELKELADWKLINIKEELEVPQLLSNSIQQCLL